MNFNAPRFFLLVELHLSFLEINAMRIFLYAALLLISISAQPQEYRRSIDINYAFGRTAVFQKGNLIGATGYEARHFDTYGVNYTRSLANTVSIYTGISWLTGKIENMDLSQNPIISRVNNTSLIYIPIGVKFSFLKYFFVKGNAILAFDTSKSSPLSNQTGIGGGMAVGAQYMVNSKLGIHFCPYFNQHGIILFNRGAQHERLMENGFQFGIEYRF